MKMTPPPWLGDGLEHGVGPARQSHHAGLADLRRQPLHNVGLGHLLRLAARGGIG